MKDQKIISDAKGFLGKIADSEKGRRLIIAAGVIGIALILLSNFLPSLSGKKEETRSGGISSEQYARNLEAQLSDVIASISGVGKSKVMVTLASGVEYVYANEQSKNSDKSEDIQGETRSRVQQSDDVQQKCIIVDSPDGGRQALVQTEILPRVQGVVVVCEGGDSPAVQQSVTDAVTTALDISSSRVCVTKLS